MWWFAQPLKGANTGSPTKVGTEGLTLHYYLEQPLQAAVSFCLLILTTRKRVNVLFEC